MLAGPPSTVTRARKLRKRMSWPEVMLWRRLRQRPCGLKFRRQHPAGPFVLDFFCSEAKVGIEIDGMAHDLTDRAERDRARAEWLKHRGVEVFRLSAAEVTKAPDAATEAIVSACLARINPLPQPPAGPPPRPGEETI
jgi:very-short-patch-repair endonuclease